MSLVGIALAVIFTIAAAVIRKSPKKALLLMILPAASGALAFVLCFAGIGSKSSSYKLLDGKTLWTFDSYSRISSSGLYDDRAVDINDTSDVYYFLNTKTIDIIKESPMTGTGPEQLVYPQLYTVKSPTGEELKSVTDIVSNNAGTFDKVYNEYLYTAATRGIPSLLTLLCILIPVLCLGFRNTKIAVEPENAVLFFVTLGGALIFLIGCSNITFAPIFWAAAGSSCVCLEKKKLPEKKKTESNS